MIVTPFLEPFCALVEVPLEAFCRHCKALHQAQSYRLRNASEDGEDAEMWFTVDFGRCAAMTEPGQCFKRCGPVAADKRQEMKDMVRGLIGGEP